MRDFQISNHVNNILLVINSDKVNDLSYSTIQYYKLKIINEINRLNNIIPVVPLVTQNLINNKLIVKLEGSIDTLNSLSPKESALQTLVRRLDTVHIN